MASINEETANRVLRQVEFYFSDSNLPRDDFLRKSVTESDDGMVSLALICSFARMRTNLGLGNIKSGDVSRHTIKAVAKILRKSDCLKVSEDGKRVGRATELSKPEEVIKQVDIRTVAASPLEYDVKIENLDSFFAEFGEVKSVRLPRHVADKRFFCGTALIELSTEGDAEKIMKQNLVYAGTKLELKPKKVFDSERERMIHEYEKTRSSADSSARTNVNVNSKLNSYPRGLIVAFTMKSRSLGGPVKNRVDSVTINHNGSSKIQRNLESSEHDVEVIAAPGETNRTALFEENNSVLCEDLKDLFQRYGTIKFVDYNVGADSGYVFYEEPEAAMKARAAAEFSEEGGLLVKNSIVSLEAIAGEAEKECWKSFNAEQKGYVQSGDDKQSNDKSSSREKRSIKRKQPSSQIYQ